VEPGRISHLQDSNVDVISSNDALNQVHFASEQPVEEATDEMAKAQDDASREAKAVDEAREDMSSLRYKLLNLGGILSNAASKIKDNVVSFFPGWEFQPSILIAALMTMFIGLTWFLVYYNYLYVQDRMDCNSVGLWKEKLKEVDAQEYGDFNPDLIIVFHHPSFECEENEEEIMLAQITEVMVESEEFEEAFPELAEARLSASDDSTAAMQRKISRDARKLSRRASEVSDSFRSSLGMSKEEKDGNAEPEGKAAESEQGKEEDLEKKGSTTHLTVKSARTALLKDLYKYLNRRGFEMTAFHSIDVDELFICASLKSSHSINHFLSQDHRALQIRSEVVAGLRDQHKPVLQDASDPASAPPLLPYEPPLVKTLLKEEIITEESETQVFKTFKRFNTESYISSNVAIQMMLNEVAEVLDLDAAAEHGMICTWFPVHSTYEWDRLTAIWGNWKAMTDLTFTQPVPELRDYFGARIAFLFAWNGVYCKALLVLVMTSVLWLLTTTIAKWVFKSNFFNERQVIGFAITLSIWCKVAHNMWQREENWFMEYWGMRHGMLDSGHAVRPSFKGEYGPSPLNSNIQEKQYPRQKAVLKRALTITVTLLFCGLVLMVIWTWMIMFEGKMGPVSAVILSLMIKVFQMIFHALVNYLVEFENHKFHEDYFNSYLWKLFVFEYVNNYSAFFFLTISNADESRCQGDPAACKIQTLQLLRSQVSMTMIVLIICSVIQVVSQIVIVKFKLWYEDYEYKKTFGKDPPPRSSHEEQAKLAKIDEATEVQNMMTLVMALGFVFHFGGVAPLALVFTLVLFTVQLRAFAKVMLAAQRVVPHRSEGIGMWSNVLSFLMVSGVVYTAFMVVVYGAAFGEASKMAKMSAFVLFVCGIFLCWKLVDLAFPSQDHEVELLNDRRNYVTKLLMRLEHKEDLTYLNTLHSPHEEEMANAIEQENFDKITGRLKTPKISISAETAT
jgi:hypothetical protein